jgi:hypothetical protein
MADEVTPTAMPKAKKEPMSKLVKGIFIFLAVVLISAVAFALIMQSKSVRNYGNNGNVGNNSNNGNNANVGNNSNVGNNGNNANNNSNNGNNGNSVSKCLTCPSSYQPTENGKCFANINNIPLTINCPFPQDTDGMSSRTNPKSIIECLARGNIARVALGGGTMRCRPMNIYKPFIDYWKQQHPFTGPVAESQIIDCHKNRQYDALDGGVWLYDPEKGYRHGTCYLG